MSDAAGEEPGKRTAEDGVENHPTQDVPASPAASLKQRKKFRPYQETDLARGMEYLRPARGRLLLHYCVAAGKTKMASAWAALLRGEGLVTHVVFAVPSRIIQTQFKREAGKIVQSNGGAIHFLDAHGKKRLRADRGGEGGALLSYLEDDDPGTVAICTYATLLGRWNRDDLLRQAVAERAASMLLVVDEGHHTHERESGPEIGGTQISDVANAWHSVGARLLRMTGTPYRYTDALAVQASGEPVIRRSVAEQMREGYAPRRILFKVLTVGGESVSSESDVAVPINLNEAVDKIVSDMRDNGWPKSIVRVRQLGDRDYHERIIRRVEKKLEQAGRTYTTLYGRENEVEDRLEECIDKEATCRRYGDLADAIVTMQRGAEGGDFPSRSHLYLLGCPTSPTALEQLIGRILRLRTQKDYPAAWLNQSRVVFVVAERADKTASFALFQATTFISSFDPPLALCDILNLHDGFRRLAPARQASFFCDHEVTIAAMRCARRLARFMAATDPPAQKKIGRTISIGEIAAIAAKYGSEILRDVDEDGAGVLARSDPDEVQKAVLNLGLTNARARDVAAASMRRFLDKEGREPIEEIVRRGLEEAYRSFVDLAYDPPTDEYRLHSDVIDDVAAIVHGATNKISALSVDEVYNRVDAYRRENRGKYPLKADVEFRLHDLNLRRAGHGGLAEIVIRRDGRSPWFPAVLSAAHDFDRRRRESRRDASKMILPGKEHEAYRHVPEIAYYPRMWEAVRRYGEALSSLTIEEAERVGQARGRNARETDRAVAQGDNAIRSYLGEVA